MAVEKFVLNSLDLNDGTKRSISDLSFKPAEARPQWADNPGADGAALVQEPHYTNAIFELSVRTRPASSADTALEVNGELLDALQACARTNGGAKVEWTPKDSTQTYTWYATLGELTELPTEREGDAAGWLLKAPLARIRLTCRPFGYIAEATAKAATESGAEPQQTLYVKCGGDVPAEVRAIVTEKSSQSRRFLEWGRDVVFSEAGNPATQILAASLVTTNFTGEAKTRSGAYSEEKVKRAVAVGDPTVMCGTGSIKNVGSFKIYGRVYAASELARFRISYRNGEGPLVPLAFVQPPVIENFSRVYLGEVTFDEALLGEQKSEIRVEVKSSDGTPIEVDLNFLELIPSTKGSARVRGQANNSPSKLLAYDTFLQTEGALTTKALPLGGTWAGAGDADDFKVIAASDVVNRTAVSDANNKTGRYAVAGSEEPTTAKASVVVKNWGWENGESTQRRGVFLRYANAENWLGGFIENVASYTVLPGIFKLVIAKRVEGTETILKELTLQLGREDFTIALKANSVGVWQYWLYSATLTTAPSPLFEGQDSVLATGGTLAKGKGGFYDAQTVATATERRFDNFTFLSAEPAGTVLYSGKAAEIRSEGYFRQDEAGTYYGEFPPRGADLYLEPEGKSGAINRLVLLARRNDVETETDSAVTDKTAVEIKVRERFIAPR